MSKLVTLTDENYKLAEYMNFISPNTAAQYNIESKIQNTKYTS